MLKLKRYESVELLIPAGSTGNKFEYPDLPQLRDDVDQDIVICGLETFSIESMPLDYNGNVVATTAQLLNSFLVLYVNGEESVRMIPFVRLLPSAQVLATGTTWYNFTAPLELDNLKVNWNKSYIQTGQSYSAGGANAQFAIMLNVYYKKLLPGAWKRITQNQEPGL